MLRYDCYGMLFLDLEASSFQFHNSNFLIHCLINHFYKNVALLHHTYNLHYQKNYGFKALHSIFPYLCMSFVTLKPTSNILVRRICILRDSQSLDTKDMGLELTNLFHVSVGTSSNATHDISNIMEPRSPHTFHVEDDGSPTRVISDQLGKLDIELDNLKKCMG